MRGSELLDRMEQIDPAYIEAAGAPPGPARKSRARWGAIAACLCLLAAGAAALPHILSGDTAVMPDSAAASPDAGAHASPGGAPSAAGSQNARTPWTAFYNLPEAQTPTDALAAPVPGYFREELSAEELAALTPEDRADWESYSGSAGFDGEGKLLEVYLCTPTTLPGVTLSITAAQSIPARDYILPGEPRVSVCGGVEFTLFQLAQGERVLLEAEGMIGGCGLRFSLEAGTDRLDRAKADFEQVLEDFALAGGPDLSAVTAQAIPEWFDRKFPTLEEARKEEPFGAYMPVEAPAGFAPEVIRHYKNWQQDSLSGLWTRGYDRLSWRVSLLSDSDRERLVGIGETEKYDLSLYPIPRADSVPDELRQVVDHPIFDSGELTLEAVRARAYKVRDAGDSDGWRMDFSVRYGDIVVEIDSKGVEPQWVWQQLQALAGP